MTKEEKRARKAKAIADKIKAKAIKHADKVARKMRKKGKHRLSYDTLATVRR